MKFTLGRSALARTHAPSRSCHELHEWELESFLTLDGCQFVRFVALPMDIPRGFAAKIRASERLRR